MSRAIGGLIFGIFLGYILQIPADEKICAIIFLTATDSICGGVVARLQENFSNKILIFGFLTNTIFGLGLIFLGNFFGIELYYVAIFILGLRIFKNFSALNGVLLKKIGS